MKNNWSHIRFPLLLVDESRVRNNIRRMVDKARRHGKVLRPHFKTHQSRIIGRWFRDEGIDRITVSSVGMAEYFAADGWQDILIAFPCNARQIDKIDDLASRIDITLLADNPGIIEILDQRLNHKVRVFIEIDTGSDRTGVHFNDSERALEIHRAIMESPFLEFAGIYSHAGHTYTCRSREEVIKMGSEAIGRMENMYNLLGVDVPAVCYGDTPACTALESFGNIVTDLSPGNFVFYDMMQVQIGVCEPDDVGVAMVCPVVTGKPDKPVWTIYGGAVHFSKDTLDDGSFGTMVSLEAENWSGQPTGKLVKVSQEHGIIASDVPLEMGEAVAILPVHSCLTAESMGKYLTLKGVYLDHYQKSR